MLLLIRSLPQVDDIKSFVSLASEDLVEMGITDDQDRVELMALMNRLRSNQSISNANTHTHTHTHTQLGANRY